MPPTISANFQGTVKEFQQSFQGLSILLIVAILVIYIVLGILYESFIHPITILSGLPSAVFGALLTLKLFHKELDLYAFVGLIMLFGVVKKNAIMMIDFALEAQRVEGKNAVRRHLSGLPAALPAHHDDHGGGAVRHAAHRAGLRRRRRCAAAAGPGGGGRTGGVAVADAVHHAGDLPVHGAIPDAAARQSGSGASGGRAGVCGAVAMAARILFAFFLASFSFFLGPGSLFGQSAPAALSDAQIHELFTQVADEDLKNDKMARDYTYTECEEEHRLDGKGHVKSTESKTYEVMQLYGSEMRRLIARNDQPLSGDDARKEEERIKKVTDKRASEDEKRTRKARETPRKEAAKRIASLCAR